MTTPSVGEPERTAGSPTTPTGRLLLDWFQSDAMPLDDYVPDGDFLAAILAIEAEARAPLEAALERIADRLERYWTHGEECECWSADDGVLMDPAVDDAHCDCGIRDLYQTARAVLAPAAPEPTP